MQNYHKSNMTLWGAVVSGVVILSIVVYYLDSSASVAPIPESQDVAQMMFIAAVIFAIAILFLKRTVLSPVKIIKGAKELPEEQVLPFVVNRIRRNYILIWAMAELIALLGFFNYIILADFQNYLIFAVVSIYSLVVNMPREALLKQSLELVKE